LEFRELRARAWLINVRNQETQYMRQQHRLERSRLPSRLAPCIMSARISTRDRKMRIAALIAAIVVSAAGLAAPQPFDAVDLVKLDRVGAPALSPDGQALAFTVRSTDYDANKAETSLWMLSLADESPAK